MDSLFVLVITLTNGQPYAFPTPFSSEVVASIFRTSLFVDAKKDAWYIKQRHFYIPVSSLEDFEKTTYITSYKDYAEITKHK